MTTVEEDFFGDPDPIVDGYSGRSRDYGLVDEDLVGFVPAKYRDRSLTVVYETVNPDDRTAIGDLQGHARRVWAGMPGGDACQEVERALAAENRADGKPLSEMGRLLRLVRLAEQGHRGAREAAEEWAAQCRSGDRDQKRMLSYAVGYTIRDGLTPEAERRCCPKITTIQFGGTAVADDAAANDPIDGAALLDDVETFIRRFVALPTEAAYVAVTLWVAHCHLLDCFENTPRLAFLSPEPGSGKTRAQEVIELLVPAPMHVLNASPAAIFRTIEMDRPTLLLDEVDTVFTRRGKDDEHQDLRGLLNSGYRAGATIPRCVGPRHEVQMFPTFCAVCLAGLGDLPDTLMTRSVVIRMRRRAPDEKVEPFRRRLHRGDGRKLAVRLDGWARNIQADLKDTYPELPVGITDRAADVWEALIAVADAADGEWPDRAREACVEMVKASRTTDSGSLGVRLLGDLKNKVFRGELHLFTSTILERLHNIDDAPWSDLRGKPLDPRGLARRLREYGVEPVKVRVGEATGKGYRAVDLHDPWQRYVPVPAEGEQGEHEEQPSSEATDSVPHADDDGEHEEQLVLHVPEHELDGEQNPPPLTSDVPYVPHVPHSAREESTVRCTLCGLRILPGIPCSIDGRCPGCVPASRSCSECGGDVPLGLPLYVGGRCEQCHEDHKRRSA